MTQLKETPPGMMLKTSPIYLPCTHCRQHFLNKSFQPVDFERPKYAGFKCPCPQEQFISKDDMLIMLTRGEMREQVR